MGGNKLSYKEFTTYLRLIVDSKLSWELQMKELINKITKYCSIFSKVRHFLPKECHLALYNSFIFSRLNYGIELYFSTNKSYYKKLITSQNRLLKILQFKPFKSNVNNLYLEFHVLTVEDLHYYKHLLSSPQIYSPLRFIASVNIKYLRSAYKFPLLQYSL